jgi:thioredoxin-related protein
MKRIMLVALAIIAFSPLMPVAAQDDSTEIHWISIDEVQAKMREQPRKVYMDMYTDWCGWCKKMEATTFQNPNVIKYMNQKYYCVKFNAERKDTIRFMGKYYYFDPNVKANNLASELMHGQMSYPTSILMEERFQNASPVPGYQDVKTMEMILKYFGENIYKTQKWEDYSKDFIQYW